MTDKVLDFIAKKVAERNAQLAAGDMTYYAVARTKNGTLSAVFAAADGARSYSLEMLSEETPFEYMSDAAQRQSRIGLVKLVQAANRVADGLATVADYPEEQAIRPAASAFYRELQFINRR